MPTKRKSKKNQAAPRRPVSTIGYNLGDLRAAKREWSERLFKGGRTPSWLQKPGTAGEQWSARALDRGGMPAFRALTLAATPDPAWNLQGVGIGEKLVDGKHTGVMAVKFLVRVKYDESHISKEHVLPKSINGVPTDVEEVGLFRRFQGIGAPNPRTKIRPAQPGCSIGFADPKNQFVMAGTFGALVKDSKGVYVLSNNHVLADEGQLLAGAPIYQPGLLDGGNPNTDQIAQLTKFVPLDASGPNQVDCAIAAVPKLGDVSNFILQIGPPKGAGDAQIDEIVQKFGRTTSFTKGRVTSVDTDVTVQYETGTFTFAEQIIVVGLDSQPFSAAGDSGSLIVDASSNTAVALLFAGSNTHTIANHINDVLQALNVSLA